MQRARLPYGLLVALLLGACGEIDTNDTDKDDPELVVPDRYEFTSRFSDESSVSYGGQTMRQVLIDDVKGHIGGLTDRIEGAEAFAPTTAEVVSELNFYFEFDAATSGDLEHGISTDPAAKQQTYADISDSNLKGKIAGNDAKGQHKDWSTEFVGWEVTGVTTPESLVQHRFKQIGTLAYERINAPATGPSGAAISKVFVTPEGQDLQQLVQKFLVGAITYSQGTDDYLDDDFEGKGLLADNTVAEEGKPYTALEHAWDEGFGYFGASRDYGDYTDAEIAGKDGRADYIEGYHDTDGDGAIDLKSEFIFALAQNAGKRDFGSAENAKTDFTKGAWDAFRRGRAIITSADGALTTAEMADLKAQRDLAVENWEKAAVATVVHYINETLADMAKFDTADYSFEDHAKHWSELKGFALGLQFNRHKKISDADFVSLHEKLGIAPVLPNAASGDIAAYKQALIDARGILADTYGLDAANVGDENGENGW